MPVIQFSWPAPNSQAIAQIQTVIVPLGSLSQDLVLNGILSQNGMVSFPGFHRTVTITTNFNATELIFGIQGTYKGETVYLENIEGPNNETIEIKDEEGDVRFFDSVTRVFCDETINGVDVVSVGIGSSGAFNWFKSGYYTGALGMGIQTHVEKSDEEYVISYFFDTTLEDAETTDPNYWNPIADLTNATASDISVLTIPTNYSRIRIASSSIDDGSVSLLATFCKQGVI
jgi:hypothetical protein